jgi:SAM-dependent methyltransferase
VFSREGPSLRELCVQALSSVEVGYDLLAPKFDHTPFRTPQSILDATGEVLSEIGQFGRGLDVCSGTGAGMEVVKGLCPAGVVGVDLSAGMLAQARDAYPDAAWVRADAQALPFVECFDLAVSFGALGHFLPAERPAVFDGVYRALRPGGLFAIAVEARPPPTEGWYWATLGFDLVMRVRNAVWRPPFVMYYRTTPLSTVHTDLAAVGFITTVIALTVAQYRDGSPRYLLVLARKPEDPPEI